MYYHLRRSLERQNLAKVIVFNRYIVLLFILSYQTEYYSRSSVLRFKQSVVQLKHQFQYFSHAITVCSEQFLSCRDLIALTFR